MTRTSRILVVDDTPANVRLLEAVLRPRGYDILAAGSGLEALELMATRCAADCGARPPAPSSPSS